MIDKAIDYINRWFISVCLYVMKKAMDLVIWYEIDTIENEYVGKVYICDNFNNALAQLHSQIENGKPE